MLSEEQVFKFKRLYESNFGRKISQEEAYKQGVKLVRLVELIYKPITLKEHKTLLERRENE